MKAQRNEKLYRRFLELLGSDKLMNIYARLGDEFWLSEERARAIVYLMHKKK